MRAAQRLRCASRPPQMRIAGGAERGRRGFDRMVSPTGSKRWKIVVYEPLTQDLAHRPRRQLVLARPTFFLIYQSTYAGSGIISGVGDHSLSSGLEGAGVDAVVALGRAARAPVPAGRPPPAGTSGGPFTRL